VGWTSDSFFNEEPSMKALGLFAVVLSIATPVFAHVGVTPRESKPGVTETYTFRVPSEGGMTTTSVVLDVPGGVTIISVAAPADAKHEEKKVGDRIVQITWTIEIKADASAQLSFVAKNPSEGASIAWAVHQRYSDGMASDWTGPAGSRSPAPVTKLVAGK
jgi:uncharacterized protein YcnI